MTFRNAVPRACGRRGRTGLVRSQRVHTGHRWLAPLPPVRRGPAGGRVVGGLEEPLALAEALVAKPALDLALREPIHLPQQGHDGVRVRMRRLPVQRAQRRRLLRRPVAFRGTAATRASSGTSIRAGETGPVGPWARATRGLSKRDGPALACAPTTPTLATRRPHRSLPSLQRSLGAPAPYFVMYVVRCARRRVVVVLQHARVVVRRCLRESQLRMSVCAARGRAMRKGTHVDEGGSGGDGGDDVVDEGGRGGDDGGRAALADAASSSSSTSTSMAA